jgi:hypothetical protein
MAIKRQSANKNSITTHSSINSASIIGDIAGSVIVHGTSTGNMGNIDLAQLATELSQLRAAMKQSVENDDHDIAIGEVAQAEKAARENNASAVLVHLKSAGSWALKVATNIGVPVAVEVLKQALSIK